MDLMRLCPNKVVSAEEAVSEIKNGSRVFIGTGCGEPQHLIKAMVNNSGIQDVLVYQMLSSTFSRYIDDESFRRRFFLRRCNFFSWSSGFFSLGPPFFNLGGPFFLGFFPPGKHTYTFFEETKETLLLREVQSSIRMCVQNSSFLESS